MKLLILLIYTPFVYTVYHTFLTTYTGVTGIEGIPEFFAIATLDRQQLDYYDSINQTLTSRQKWLKEFESTDMWKEDTEIRRHVQQIYKNNIYRLMKLLNQSDGIHTFQRMYGCSWNNETAESYGFNVYGYDGEDFIVLDVKEGRYITPTAQAISTINKWNHDRAHIELMLQYYRYECVYWLKNFLDLRKDDLKSTAPEVFLLQKEQSSAVSCQATGFYPSGVMISWRKNGQDHYEDVEIGETLLNEDGTFQRTSYLSVDPEHWKKNEYICVVEHNMKKIQKMLSVYEIKSNNGPDIRFFVLLPVIVMLMIIVPAVIYVVRQKKLRRVCQKLANLGHPTQRQQNDKVRQNSRVRKSARRHLPSNKQTSMRVNKHLECSAVRREMRASRASDD